MSITFYGKNGGQPIMLPLEHASYLNLANSNAYAFLSFLGLEPGDGLTGEVSIHDARRAVIAARARFEQRVDEFTREPRDTKPPGVARLIEGGIDRDYFKRRLDAFEQFLITMGGLGARVIYWA